MNAEQHLVDAFGRELPVALARWLEAHSPSEVATLFSELSPSTTAAVLERLLPSLAARVLELLPCERGAEALEELDPFAAARLLSPVEELPRKELLALLRKAHREAVTKLLVYSPEHAGGRMDPRAPSTGSGRTVQEGLLALESAREGALNYLYVTDERHRLVGVVSIRELLSSPRGVLLSEVMRRDPDRLRATDSIQNLVAHPAWRGVHALPVVDAEQRFLGAIRYSTFRALEAELNHSGTGPDPSRTANALAELVWVGTLAAVRTAETVVFGRSRDEEERR